MLKERNGTEEIYISSAKKLRESLPKFVIFLGTAFFIWLFGYILLVPLGEGIFIGNIAVTKINTLIIGAAIIVLIVSSFREIRNVADAFAGIITYYISGENKIVGRLRLIKLQGTLRSFAYVILVSLLFLMFRGVLDTIHPALSGLVLITLVIWAIFAIYMVVMALSGEAEEAAKELAKKIEKRVKRRRRR